ncbi:MAG: hypothetical protein AAF447_07425, partial [Myxococcota bacterium]
MSEHDDESGSTELDIEDLHSVEPPPKQERVRTMMGLGIAAAPPPPPEEPAAKPSGAKPSAEKSPSRRPPPAAPAQPSRNSKSAQRTMMGLGVVAPPPPAGVLPTPKKSRPRTMMGLGIAPPTPKPPPPEPSLHPTPAVPPPAPLPEGRATTPDAAANEDAPRAAASPLQPTPTRREDPFADLGLPDPTLSSTSPDMPPAGMLAPEGPPSPDALDELAAESTSVVSPPPPSEEGDASALVPDLDVAADFDDDAVGASTAVGDSLALSEALDEVAATEGAPASGDAGDTDAVTSLDAAMQAAGPAPEPDDDATDPERAAPQIAAFAEAEAAGDVPDPDADPTGAVPGVDELARTLLNAAREDGASESASLDAPFAADGPPVVGGPLTEPPSGSFDLPIGDPFADAAADTTGAVPLVDEASLSSPSVPPSLRPEASSSSPLQLSTLPGAAVGNGGGREVTLVLGVVALLGVLGLGAYFLFPRLFGGEGPTTAELAPPPGASGQAPAPVGTAARDETAAPNNTAAPDDAPPEADEPAAADPTLDESDREALQELAAAREGPAEEVAAEAAA